MKLTRHPANPILEPITAHPWESRNVFNTGVTSHGGEIVLLYRGQGHENAISRLGFATSRDGVHFERRADPVFVPETADEVQGVEDPRLTLIDGRYQMLYTAWAPDNIQVARASTTDFVSWERHGIVFPGPDNKDAALFPFRIGGRYCAFHRIPSSMWIAWSDDLAIWGDYQRIMDPRPGCYDDWKLGAGSPPIETDLGWLVIYHGVDTTRRYCLGVALLDRDDPSKVINRPKEPVLEPEEPWELVGDVPNVVFTCGTAEVGDEYFIYYGGADRVIGLATANKAVLLDFAANG
ncbi:MAG TPA: hypothetical protein VD767_07270 [Thermomicrobiales bacterium]|nr:hypothetical protein [Thermomicrobiales bacterium]